MKNLKTYEEWNWNPFKKLSPEEEYEKQKKQAAKEREELRRNMSSSDRDAEVRRNIEDTIMSTRNPGDRDPYQKSRIPSKTYSKTRRTYKK